MDVISENELDGARCIEKFSTENRSFDKDKYIDIMSVWHCFVCNKCVDDPVRISTCHHGFCYSCISDLRNCPKCGVSFTKKDIRFCIMLSNYVSFYEQVTKAMDLQSTENNSNSTNMEEESANKGNVKKETFRESITMKKKLPKQKKQHDSSNSTYKSYDKHLELEKTGNKSQLHMKRKTSSGSRLKQSMEDSKVSSNEASPARTPNSQRKLERKPKGTPRNRIIENKIKTPEIEKRNAKGETPLHSACVKKDLQSVISLLEKGANPNVKDFAGWTPLTEAVCKGNLPLVETLLKHGAWPNVPAVLNTTPLLEAVLQKNKEMIKLLLQHGADINQRSSLNNTPLSLAAEEDENIHSLLLNHKPVLEVLEEVNPPLNTAIIPAVCSEENNIFEICEELDFEVKPFFWRNASHIVTTTDEQLNCECTVNILKGILNGVNIVSTSWLLECQKSKSVIPIDCYEVKGTYNYPNTGVPKISKLNAYKLNPKLFDGCHISITGVWQDSGIRDYSKQDIISLIQESGAVYLFRDPDPEEIPQNEKTVMFHCKKGSFLELVSHIILYQPNSDPKKEPLLKYNMQHVKTLPTTWFLKCIQTFSLCDL